MTIDKDRIMDEFRHFIDQSYRPGGVLVSTIGHRWKALNPDIHWGELGFMRMSDALYAITDAPDSNWEVLNRGTPQMLLRKLSDPVEPAPLSFTTRTTVGKGQWIPRLIPDVWFAFVNEAHWGKRYLNRETVEVKMDVESPPDANDENWLEITPISQPDQQNWARDFLKEMNLTDRGDLSEAIEQSQWYLHFGHKLRANAALNGAWNAYRSRRVSDYVEAWCKANNVNIQRLRAPDKFAISKSAAATQAPNLAATTADRQAKSELRRILLNAFARLHTHEMLQMQMPSYAVISVLRPDLLD